MSRILDNIEEFIEMQGIKRGTLAFERAVRKEKVARCMATQAVESCTVCPLFTDCSLRLAYWRDLSLGPEYVDENSEDNMDDTE